MHTSRTLRLAAIAVLLACASAQAQDTPSCSSIPDDAARLRCYDARFPPAGQQTLPANATTAPLAVPAGAAPASALGRRWELDPGTRAGPFTFRPHHQNYLLPITHTSSVNTAVYQPTLDALAGAGLIPKTTLPVDANEAAFQLSFKVKAWEDIVPGRMDLWLGYTQQSYWQVYNDATSAPFRDTNYQPEAMLAIRADQDVLGLNWRYVALGLVHQSNGRSEPLSRSWNRVYAELGFERGDFAFWVKPWYRLKESVDKDDNPDITKYLGHGELVASYKAGRQQFGFTGRYNPSSGYGSGQLDWSFPLAGPLRGYVQVFSGYGYNLLDYNHKQTVGGIGVLLTDRL